MVSKYGTRPVLAMICGSALVLGGCQNMTDTNRTQAEGAVGGAAVGAVLGALLGGGKGAAIGAGAGSLLGLGFGSAVANKKQQYAAADRSFDFQIQQTEANNQRLAQHNQALSAEITEYRREIAALQGKVRAGTVDNVAAARLHQQIQAKYAESTRYLDDEKHELADLINRKNDLSRSAGVDDGRTRQTNEQVIALSDSINVLQQQVDTMASQSNQLEQFQ